MGTHTDHTDATRGSAELHEVMDGTEPPGPADAFPVPVFAVEPVAVDELALRAWTVTRTPVPTGAATRAVAGQPARRRLRITNAGAVTIYLAPDQPSATDTSGFPLPAGATVELRTRHELWAGVKSDAASSGDLAALAEYVDG